MKGFGQMYQQQQQSPAAYQQMYQQAQASPAQQAGYMQKPPGMQASPGYQATQQSFGAGAAFGQAQQAQQAPQQDELIGNVARITVQGCTHAMVGGIVRGSFTANGQNHGRPTYKKDQQVNGLDVQMYYWDERDGPNFSGWWFGPKVGGDQVWAYHPNKEAMTPPKTGWKVPYDGPVDQTFVISPSGGQQQAQQQPQQQAQQQPQQQAFQQNQQQAYQQQQQQQQQQRLQQQQQQQQQQQMLKQQEQQKQQQLQQQMKQQQEEARKQQEQLKQQQMMAMKQKQEEMRLKQQEELKRKAEEQKRKMEEQKQKQEEEKRQREEAQRKKMEDQKKAAEEAKTAFEVRKIIQQVRLSTAETLASKQQELAEIMAKNLPNCGAAADKLKTESEQAVEQAKKRIEAAAETKRKDEERKAEAAKKLKEAQDKAEALVKELSGKVDSAEEAVKALTAAAEALEGTTLKMTAIKKASSKVDDAIEEATTSLQACSSFMTENGAAMKVPAPAGAKPTSDPAGPTYQVMVAKFNELSKTKNSTAAKAGVTKSALTKKVEAKTQFDGKASKIGKFDANKDGIFDEKEITSYAKKEFGLSLPKAAMTQIMASLAQDGKKGVQKDNWHSLSVQVGVAREANIDAKRRQKREAHEKQVELMKTSLREKIAEVEQTYSAVEGKLKQAEEAGRKALAPAEIKSKKSQEILPLVEEVETKLQEARESAEELQKDVAGIKEDVNPELLTWITNESKPLTTKNAHLKPRIQNVSNQLTRARADAKVKDAAELKALEAQITEMLKYHQNAKSITIEDVFAAMSKDKESVDKASFIAFFQACEKQQPSDAEEGKAGKVASAPSDEDLERAFNSLVDKKDSETISKDRMLSLIRMYMKVIKDTVLTSSLSIKATDSKRRLEVGEILEILSPPSTDGEADEVKRVQCRTLKDNLEGWATVSGNKGTTFLQPHTLTFKVVKETIMTETFELDSDEAKEAWKQLKDREPRKLRPGELVEVWILPKKEEKSGLERLKCRTKTDGLAGWVTAVGNAGTVFLQMA